MWLKRESMNAGAHKFHVGFLKSTSPLLTEFRGNQMTLNVVGGQIFLKFFLGDTTPESVIRAYHNYINGYLI
jgi:alpha-glucosidase